MYILTQFASLLYQIRKSGRTLTTTTPGLSTSGWRCPKAMCPGLEAWGGGGCVDCYFFHFVHFSLTARWLSPLYFAQVFEDAVSNIPLIEEKNYWRRYIYIWIFYAMWVFKDWAFFFTLNRTESARYCHLVFSLISSFNKHLCRGYCPYSWI